MYRNAPVTTHFNTIDEYISPITLNFVVLRACQEGFGYQCFIPNVILEANLPSATSRMQNCQTNDLKILAMLEGLI